MNTPLLSPERRLELEVAARSQAHVAPLMKAAMRSNRRAGMLLPSSWERSPSDALEQVRSAEAMEIAALRDLHTATCLANRKAAQAKRVHPTVIPPPSKEKPCKTCEEPFVPRYPHTQACDACKGNRPPARRRCTRVGCYRLYLETPDGARYCDRCRAIKGVANALPAPRARLLDGAV